MKAIVILLPLLLTGCITDQDANYLDRYFSGYYSRADVDALNAQVACKQLARTLVQISRCEVRR
jgi:hypothetical protein